MTEGLEEEVLEVGALEEEVDLVVTTSVEGSESETILGRKKGLVEVEVLVVGLATILEGSARVEPLEEAKRTMESKNHIK